MYKWRKNCCHNAAFNSIKITLIYTLSLWTCSRIHALTQPHTEFRMYLLLSSFFVLKSRFRVIFCTAFKFSTWRKSEKNLTTCTNLNSFIRLINSLNIFLSFKFCLNLDNKSYIVSFFLEKTSTILMFTQFFQFTQIIIVSTDWILLRKQ